MSEYRNGQVWMWNNCVICMLLKRLESNEHNIDSELWHVIDLDDASLIKVVMHNKTYQDGAHWERL